MKADRKHTHTQIHRYFEVVVGRDYETLNSATRSRVEEVDEGRERESVCVNGNVKWGEGLRLKKFAFYRQKK